MLPYIQVQITFPVEESAEKTTAERVAERLVETRLAACAQILGPIRSHYIWKGKTERQSEMLLLAKTRHENFDRLVEAVRESHPYECPQIVALPLVAGNDDYLAWMEEHVV